MGAKLSKKGFNMADEKPAVQKAEEPTEAATVTPEENKDTNPDSESSEKRYHDSHVSTETDQEGGGVPAGHTEEACKPESRQLDELPDEEHLVAIATEETTESPEKDPAQPLEVSTHKGVESRQQSLPD